MRQIVEIKKAGVDQSTGDQRYRVQFNKPFAVDEDGPIDCEWVSVCDGTVFPTIALTEEEEKQVINYHYNRILTRLTRTKD